MLPSCYCVSSHDFHNLILFASGNLLRELVWLENEGSGFSEGWRQHVVATGGPDISFATATLTAGGRHYDCVLTCEFFNQRTSIFWTESLTDDWSDLSQVSRSFMTSPEVS